MGWGGIPKNAEPLRDIKSEAKRHIQSINKAVVSEHSEKPIPLIIFLLKSQNIVKDKNEKSSF